LSTLLTTRLLVVGDDRWYEDWLSKAGASPELKIGCLASSAMKAGQDG
jgi:hypothetical protein